LSASAACASLAATSEAPSKWLSRESRSTGCTSQAGVFALQAEHSLGLRESITRRYDELVRALAEQLGLEPARETRMIYRQLLGQA
jgi:DNA-binding SARP family transcriptional activator